MNYQEWTVNEFINSYKETDINFGKLHYKTIHNTNEGKKLILLDDAIYIHYPEINDMLVKTTFDNFEKYRYNPKVMSYDLYGTTELWGLLLRANNMYSASQFNINPLYIFPANIIDFLNEIIDLNKPIIDANDAQITNEILKS